jgi:phospholipase/carboxylesterase
MTSGRRFNDAGWVGNHHAAMFPLAYRMKIFSKILSFIFVALLATTVRAQEPNLSNDSELHRDLSLQYLVHLPARAATHSPVVILLHGMGSNEQDLYSLQPFFPRRYAVVSVRAPYTLGDGHYQWFEGTMVHGRLDGNPQQLALSRARISRFIDEVVKEYGFDQRQVYLVGFSQGAIMSYQVALTEPGKIKGIGVMSGAIFSSFIPQIKPSAGLSRLRIFISHGQADNTIPLAYAQEANQLLLGLGLTPAFHVYPGMQHEINRDALQDLVRWLQEP